MQLKAILSISSPLWSTLEMHVVSIGILGKPQQKIVNPLYFSNSSA
jgi:hypothetical protein